MILTTNQKEVIEQYWMMHTQYKKDLHTRMVELQQKGISDFTKDMRYNHLKKVVGAIDQVTASIDEDLKDFAEMRYLSDDAEFFDWDDVANALGTTKPKAFNLRNKLVSITAKKIRLDKPILNKVVQLIGDYCHTF